jgi:TolA-binding protein
VQGRDDERDAEEGEFQLAINPAQPDAPVSEVYLGVLLRRQGNVAGAKAAYQRAIGSGHPDQAPKAAFNLGALLEDRGDTAGAKATYLVILLEELRQSRG